MIWTIDLILDRLRVWSCRDCRPTMFWGSSYIVHVSCWQLNQIIFCRFCQRLCWRGTLLNLCSDCEVHTCQRWSKEACYRKINRSRNFIMGFHCELISGRSQRPWKFRYRWACFLSFRMFFNLRKSEGLVLQ